MIRKQYTLFIENKLGALAKIARVLAAANVNIDGMSISESTDVGLVQLIASNAAAARKAFVQKRIAYSVQDVVIVPLPNKPGALAELSDKLSRAKVNINYMYGTTCKCGKNCDCSVVISASKLQAVEKLLG